MRVANSFVIFSSADPTTNSNGSAFLINTAFACSMQVVATGTPGTGTVKLQVSNDPANPTNWVDVTSGSVTLSGTTVLMVQVSNLCNMYIRAVYTKAGSPSTGSITATLVASRNW